MLLNHNEPVYRQLCDMLDAFGQAIILACTGHGKSYIIKEYLEQHDVEALVVCTGREIKENWQRVSDRIVAVTYQAFSNMQNPPQYPVTVFDEAHHLCSPVWGKKAREFVNNYDGLVIGLTADSRRYSDGGKDVADEFFDGHVVYGYTLAQAIENEILPSFTYVCTLAEVEKRVEKARKYQTNKANMAIVNHLVERLQYTAENVCNISRILSDHMPDGLRKGILFVDSIEAIEDGVKLAQENFQSPVWQVHSAQAESLNAANKAAFEEAAEGWCVTVNKFNEGLHIPGVNTIIMLRRTKSPTVFFQQIGRAMASDNLGQQVIIFDFVGNNASLKTISTNVGELLGIAQRNTSANKRTQIIVKDYASEALSILNSIEELINGYWSEEEIAILREWYPKEGTGCHIRLPGRTPRGIKQKARSLNLSAPKTQWSEEEDEILKEKYGKIPTNELSVLLERSLCSVQHRARALGLTQPKRRWTTAEEKIIREKYPLLGMKTLEFLPGHTNDQLQGKVREMKLHLAGGQAGRPFSQEEDAILRKYYPLEGGNVCKRLPERSRPACCNRARALDLQSPNNIGWTAEEDCILQAYYLQEGKACLARLPNRTWRSCLARAHTLGITRQTKPKWSPEEIDTLKTYQNKGIQELEKLLPGRSRPSIYRKASELKISLKKE